MSGGHWDYKNDYLCNDMFSWHLSVDYGESGFKQSAAARKMNPLEDKVISEIVWDVFCLLHSYDWYICGDCCEETYRKDVEYFKKKWFGRGLPKKRVQEIVDDELNGLKESLYEAFGVQHDED